MYSRILVPLDGSPTAQRGLEEALRLARLTQGQLRLLHVVDELTYTVAWDMADGTAARWHEMAWARAQELLDAGRALAIAGGIPAETTLADSLEGRMAELVVREARRFKADLLVLGTHGRRGLGRLVLGSGAEQVLRLSPVPVLLVRAPDEEVAQAAPAAAPGAEEAAVPSGHVRLVSGALSIE